MCASNRDYKWKRMEEPGIRIEERTSSIHRVSNSG